MNINDFYIHAIRGRAHWLRSWVIRAFALSIEQPDDWKKDKVIKPWRIVRTAAGVGFLNESLELTPIEGADPQKPLLTALTPIQVPPNFFSEWPEGGVTAAGNLFYNATALWPTVGAKFGYMNERVNQKAVEKLFAAKMLEDPEMESQKDPNSVYVSDWLRYGQAIKYLEEFTQVFVWSLTRNSVVPNQQVLQRKAELLKAHAHELDNPVVQAKINKELSDLDSSLLANDPGASFVGTGKSKLARQKLTIMYGSERGLDVGSDPQLITRSLHDGLEPKNLVDVMNVSRAGSFDRGSETMLGGVEAKWGDRIMAAAKMQNEDCGTKLGYTYTVTKDDIENTIGRNLMEGQGLRMIATEAEAKALLGQRITVRTPARCKAGPSVVWCRNCLGQALSANDKSLGLAVSGYGSGFLQLFLQSMHAKAPVTVTLNVRALMS